MINFKRYPYRVGETYGLGGGLTKRQITMAINKPERQARKLREKLPLLADQIKGGQVQNFDADAEYKRRQALMDDSTRRNRQRQAELWHKARKLLFACTDETRARALARFNGNRWTPKTPSRLLDIIDQESGAQAKRLAKIERADAERQAQRDAEMARQLSIFT